jgi:hypothetical protein
MPEITSQGKLFFSIKTIGGWSLTADAVSVRMGITRSGLFQSFGK